MDATPEIVAKLASFLNLPLPGPFSQDWELEVADSTRVREFLEAYDSDSLNHDHRYMLIQTILESYRCAVDEGLARPEDWETISYYLNRDRPIHEDTIRYWAMLDEPDLENCFAITPLIRTLA